MSRTYRGEEREDVCSGWPSLVSWLSSVNLITSRVSVGVVESILKALLVLVASTGEKLVARRTGRGATRTRLSSVALKLMSEREREMKGEGYLGSLTTAWANRGGRWVRGESAHHKKGSSISDQGLT